MNTSIESIINESFEYAVKDYLFLLEKRYPEKQVRLLVSDRYSLETIQRTVLYRGIATAKESEKRGSKMVGSISGKELHIDTFNVIITVCSYLTGTLVFISTDNFLRDASEARRKLFRPDLMKKSLNLIINNLPGLSPSGITFHIDRPLLHSDFTENEIRNITKEYPFQVTIKMHGSADREMKKLDQGIISTSDSQIIDSTSLKCFDLARYTLERSYKPTFLDLNHFVS